MSPDNPLLRALLAQPDDDTLRLAMADWLDENDQPERAEFIRVQVELARGVEELDRRRQLELRQRDLLIAHEAEWVKPLADVLDCKPGVWGGWVFRRGFVEYFHLPAQVVNRHGERLARLTPVRELYLCPCISLNIVWLCKKPWLRSVTRLRVRGGRVGAYGLPDPQGDCLNADAIRALIGSPHLGKMEVLDVFASDDVSEKLAKAFRQRFGHQLLRSPHA
jgi:uncharacterized protein (TIGR02996 family)